MTDTNAIKRLISIPGTYKYCRILHLCHIIVAYVKLPRVGQGHLYDKIIVHNNSFCVFIYYLYSLQLVRFTQHVEKFVLGGLMHDDTCLNEEVLK